MPDVRNEQQKLSRGILPLKVQSGLDGREIDRARLLINSLEGCWKGQDLFTLYVVCIDEEISRVSEHLAQIDCKRIRLSLVPESKLFPKGSPFYALKGMYKQQLIKLFAFEIVGAEFYLTFDADVICLKAFDENTFIRESKAISAWEGRSFHSWWINSAITLDLPSRQDCPGLSVTPNILHADICQCMVARYATQNTSLLSRLCTYADNHPRLHSIDGEGIPLAWSEYSLYSIFAENESILERYHVPFPVCNALEMRLHSRRNVWYAGDEHRLIKDEGDPGFFIVIQSWAGIPIEVISSKLGLVQ